MNPQATHGLRILAVAVAVVSVALWQGLTHRYRPILERSTQVKLDPTVDVASIAWIDGHTAIGKCGDDLPCVVDRAANSVRLLPRVPIAPVWDNIATSRQRLNGAGKISADNNAVLWSVSSGITRIPLTGGVANQIITYPKVWLERNKTYPAPGGYPGTGYPGSSFPSSPPTSANIIKPVISRAQVPNPDYVRSILWLNDSKHWLSVEFSGTGSYWLRLHDYDGSIVNQVQLPGIGDNQYWKLLGKLPGNRALLRAGEKSFVTVDIDRGLSAQNVFPVTPPPDCYVAIPSPDGRRLLWEGDIEPGPYTWLDSLRSHFESARYEKERMWGFTVVLAVSDLNGKNVQELCREGPGFEGPYAIQWTPDSKHITFVMNKKLWMLPVP